MKKIQLALIGVVLFISTVWGTSIESWKDSYNAGDDVWIELKGKPNNVEDWIGIYPAGSSNDWGNMVKWSWTRDTSPTEVDQGDWYKFEGLPDGSYEARFFLNNSFVLENKVSLSVGTSIKINNERIEPNENIQISLTGHSGDQDWVGIYPVGTSNDWGNVVSWTWANSANLNIALEDAPLGEYEARLFFHNSFNDEARSNFSVVSQNNNDYKGYHNTERYPEDGSLHNNYVVYYPKNAITPDMPVVLFLEGGGSNPNIDDHEGVMRYLASRGYFVIGAESGDEYSSDFALGIFHDAINTAKATHNLNISKLAVMGHSQGGGEAFYVMKSLLNEGYGSDKSLVVSIDGWFSFNMNQEDLRGLDSEIFFIQMNGVNGTGTDPRIPLSIWNLANNSEKKFLTLPHNNHNYSVGNLETMINQKEDLLYLLGAISDDVFTDSPDGYTSIPEVHKASYDNIYNALKQKEEYPYDCAGVVANAKEQLDYFNIDYCAMIE